MEWHKNRRVQLVQSGCLQIAPIMAKEGTVPRYKAARRMFSVSKKHLIGAVSFLLLNG